MSPGGDSLIQRVAERLQSGPAHTLALARDVLGLSGHEGAASAAVFSLLGANPRFTVDAAGVWALSSNATGPDLATLTYAVVDVETTGGAPMRGDRITEIAVVEVAEGSLTDEWATLVNPGRSVPPVVTALTGITHDMVSRAPYFDHVAPEVADRLRARVFVAHNAAFDRRFVRHELIQAAGEAPSLPTLCTVQLSRGLLPRLRRRNLDALAGYFGVKVHDRHRALGDARATARVLLKLLEEAAHQGITDLDTLRRIVRRRVRRRQRPPPKEPA